MLRGHCPAWFSAYDGGDPGVHWAILAGETACALAFGASWFAKGAEFDYLLGRTRR